MANPPTVNSFLEAIQSAAQGRYRFAEDVFEEVLFDAIQGVDQPAPAVKIIRLQRLNHDDAGWKTMIIAIVDRIESRERGDNEQLERVLTLAANIRAELLGAEPYDLYLLLGINNSPANIDPCLRLEATEQFCRKYVLRPEETVHDLLERTFLGTPAENSEITIQIQDPLIAALRATQTSGTEHQWFTIQQQEIWREALLSGETADALIEMLFVENESDIHEDEQ